LQNGLKIGQILINNNIMPKTKFHAIAAIDPEEVEENRLECYHESTSITDNETKQQIECHYLFVGYRYPSVENADGSVTQDKVGRLILTPLRGEETWDSWGLSQFNPNVPKFTMNINMWDQRNEPENGSPEKQRWFAAYKNVMEMIKRLVVSNREELGDPDMEISDLRKFTGYNSAKDKQTKRIDNSRPQFIRLKVPAFADKETREIRFIPDFYEFGEQNPYPRPEDLLKKQMDTRVTIYIESVFRNAAWTVPQLFVHDAEFGLRQQGSRRMISASSRRVEVRAADAVTAVSRNVDVSNLSSGAFAVLDDDSDDETTPAPVASEQKSDEEPVSGEEDSDSEETADEPEPETPPAPAATIRRRQPQRRRQAKE
jgi:hypothetical protein